MATVGFTERVTVSGTDRAVETLAKSDTGAKRTSIGHELADKIGIGPPVGTTTVRSSNGREERPIVPVTVHVQGTPFELDVSVTDRSEMNYPIILGRDVLQHFNVDVTQKAE